MDTMLSSTSLYEEVELERFKDNRSYELPSARRLESDGEFRAERFGMDDNVCYELPITYFHKEIGK